MMGEFVGEVKNMVSEMIGDVHTAFPGKIVSVDASKGTCTVLPVMKIKTGNGKLIDYPKISGVPIVFPQGIGGDASIVFPVKAGDGCLLIVSEQSLDYWMYGMVTDSNLKFDITNAVCIPGLFKKLPSTFSEAVSEKAVIIDAGGVQLKVSPKEVTIKGNLKVKGTIESA